MKPLVNGRFVIAVLTVACLMTVLVAGIRSSFSGAGDYNLWLDVNNDNKIDMKDIGSVERAFGALGAPGQNVSKASINYTSDWIDITDRCGQNIVITHDLSSTDLIVDIQGKTTLDSGLHQRNYGLTGYIQGWNQSYGGTSDDYARALMQTVDGGYALAGWTDSFGAGNKDALLVRTDGSGNMIFNKTYGGASWDYASALVQGAFPGGYALAGYTNSSGAGDFDFWLVGTDIYGNMIFNKTYGGASWDYALALVQTSGSYVMAGYTSSFGDYNVDAWLVKADGGGNMLWNMTYGGTDWEMATALVQTSDGGYALAGQTSSYGAGWSDFWLVKTDANGTMQWNQTYGGTGNDEATALVQTSDGGYALAGDTTSFGDGGPNIWLVKTDANGTMQWNKTYVGTWASYDEALVQTSDGGYALTGRIFNTVLIKTDAYGNMEWNKNCSGINGWYRAFALLQTTDGGIVVAGGVKYRGAYNYDFWLVKTDVESGLAWVDSSANTITLYRGATDAYWNYVRVRLWKPR